jgi:hypothetical protein
MSQYGVEQGKTKHDPAVIYAYEHHSTMNVERQILKRLFIDP